MLIISLGKYPLKTGRQLPINGDRMIAWKMDSFQENSSLLSNAANRDSDHFFCIPLHMPYCQHSSLFSSSICYTLYKKWSLSLFYFILSLTTPAIFLRRTLNPNFDLPRVLSLKTIGISPIPKPFLWQRKRISVTIKGPLEVKVDRLIP